MRPSGNEEESRKKQSDTGVPRIGRRWCVPPAISSDSGELFEGMPILRELKGDVALLLWCACRDVRLWASTPASRRDGLFSPGAAERRMQTILGTRLSLALAMPLDVMTGVLGDPAAADAETVSVVCLHVAEWAAERGALGTAVSFAQAAAEAASERGEPALQAGRLARRWGRRAMAETWLRRAVAVARREKDWSVYASAYTELGSIYADRGEYLPAQRHYQYAVRAARRHGLRQGRAAALQGLMRMALRAGDYARAYRYGIGARKAFGRDHPQTPHVLADLGVIALRQGRYADAAVMLRSVLRAQAGAPERAQLLAALTHASAGAGDADGYARNWDAAWDLLSTPKLERETAAGVLRELSRAAALASDTPRQRAVVERSRQLPSTDGSDAPGASPGWRLVPPAGDEVPAPS